jgi:phosphinothricin acetyltransferase
VIRPTSPGKAPALIRPADPDGDAAACAAIYAPYVTDTVISFEEEAPNEAEMRSRIERFSRTHAWLVADVDDHVVGFAFGCPHRERAAYRWAADVSVYIDQSAHRRGVGRALYGQLFEVLAGRGVQVLCAGIGLPNEASVALHESLGFVAVGIYRRIGFKHGAWRDVGWWQLDLAPAGGRPAELR